MKPQSFVELISGGNINEAEEAWMAMIESPDVTLAHLVPYDIVLRELATRNQKDRAATMAWAAIENLLERFESKEVLTVAGPFVVAVGEGEELRSQAVKLYQQAFEGQEGLEELLTEAGVGGGRPLRRAVRTMRVCLELKEGDFLLEGDEQAAARVERVDRQAWQFAITGPDGPEELGAVHLADRFVGVPADEFHVMRQFQPEALLERLAKDPVSIISDLCRNNENKIDSDELLAILVPSPLSATEWKKWWTKARTAIRRSPNLAIEGRSPYYLTYTDTPASLEEGQLKKLAQIYDPGAQLDLVDGYFRDCSAQGKKPCDEFVGKMLEDIVSRAEKAASRSVPEAAGYFAVALRIAHNADLEGGVPQATSFFEEVDDIEQALLTISNDTLLTIACDCVRSARSNDWPNLFKRLLPRFPAAVCDYASGHLIDAGQARDDFDPIMEAILAFPIAHFDALLWLWDGPKHKEVIPVPGLVALISRIIRALDDARRDDTLAKETIKRLSLRARAVLGARKYERFDECLELLDSGRANALHTQMRQLDSLGRSVRDDLMARLRRKFPIEKAAVVRAPWERDDILFVSQTGMRKKHEEIEYHINVKMKENSKAIGDAAEKGDLSENSEYKFALEERDLLRARLALMNAEMAIANVLAVDDVPVDHAGIGTKLIFRRVEDGQSYEISLVGSWDADSERQRINYKTPLAGKLLGKKVGDTIVFDHTGAEGEYEIVALENGQEELV